MARSRVKSLARNLAIYGVGDVATSLVSLLLLPIYTRYLSPADYGVIAMLLTVEAVAKILFRWGVDTAFMRMYYDCADQAARQRLASTLFLFLLVLSGSLLVIALAGAEWLSALIFGAPGYGLLLALTLLNIFVASFFFIPLHVLRIGERSGQFIALSSGRSVGTLVARLVLVIGAGMGVLGVVVADLIVSAIFALVLTRWFAPLVRPLFSTATLREALHFGLPRLPHSLAQHVIGLADRYFLNAFGTLRDVGLYSIGASFGLGLKLFLSAFEYAWTPFFLGVMREPDAGRIYGSVSTYAIAALIVLVAGLCAVATDVVRLATTAEFHQAAAVTPWIALGVMFQGFYLVGSIGIIITKRTSRYPLATGFAAIVSLTANALLIPRYGFLGAAWANTIAYFTLAVITIGFSWRLYPIPYEWGRLARIAVAGLAAYLAAAELVPSTTGPVAGLLLRGSVTVAGYGLVLLATGFFLPGELGVLQDIYRRVMSRKPTSAGGPEPGQVEMAGEILAPAPEPSIATTVNGALKESDHSGSARSPHG